MYVSLRPGYCSVKYAHNLNDGAVAVLDSCFALVTVKQLAWHSRRGYAETSAKHYVKRQLHPTLVEAVCWEPHGTVVGDSGEVSRVGKNGHKSFQERVRVSPVKHRHCKMQL